MMACDSPFKAVDAACSQAQCVKYVVETGRNVLWLQSCVHLKVDFWDVPLAANRGASLSLLVTSSSSEAL